MTKGRTIRFGLGLVLLSALMSLVAVLAAPGRAHAEGLQIRPLLYTERLKAGETKRGFVDVSNATHSPVTAVLKVQGFRQVDGRGTLEFYESETVREGVQLDLTEVELGPSEAVRVYFQIDPAKLTAGDNFAAIFAATRTASASGGAAPSAQVGTLLILENGSGGPHNAAVTKVSAPWIGFGDTLHGTATVHNTGKAKQSSAFFPQLTTTVGPWFGASNKTLGPLVFSGITRTAPIEVETRNMLGIYRLTVSANSGASGRWVLLVTGIWRWILLTLAAAAVGIWYWSRRYKLELQWVAWQKPRLPYKSIIDWLSDFLTSESKTRESESSPPEPERNIRQVFAMESKKLQSQQASAVEPQNNPQITPTKQVVNNTANVAKKTTKNHRPKGRISKEKMTTKTHKKH